MLQRFCLMLLVSLQALAWGGVTSEASLTHPSKTRFSLSDFFKPFRPSTYKMSSSSVLQALGKFLPVQYQKGVNSAFSGCPYHIGDFAQGGVIIFLTHDGMHGLVAAIEDASPPEGVKWSTEQVVTRVNNYDSLPYSTPVAPYGQYYAGYKNQEIIQQRMGWETTYPAFKVAAEYTRTVNGVTYDGWFLPSTSELSLIFAMREIINQVSKANGGAALLDVEFNIINYPASIYWSSRENENDSNSAWYLSFFDGNQSSNNKGLPFAVRCVRAF
jgi:hypothetical protein